MKTLRIGIADYGQMKERTLAIARGDYRPAGEGAPAGSSLRRYRTSR